MSDRDTQITGFLDDAGWQGATRTALAGDASARRYDRLMRAESPQKAVLMDAPTTAGDSIPAFLRVAGFLSNAGFSAPEIFAQDLQNGFVLMEDLGDDLYARICADQPKKEPLLYRAAVDMLLELHQLTPPELPAYNADIYLREALLLTNWYLPAATANDTTAALQAEYSDLLQAACARITHEPPVCVLRDYHSENLLWLPNRKGTARVGQLDFQDALLGHPAYDLVSLLEDARRDTGQDLQTSMLAYYLEHSGLNPTPFRLAYATLGAQRNLKIIGVFARLCCRDGKPGYVDLIPRVWAHLMRDLDHPELRALRDFVISNIPAPSKPILAQIKRGCA